MPETPKGMIHGDWIDMPGKDLNLIEKTKISTTTDSHLVISLV